MNISTGTHVGLTFISRGPAACSGWTASGRLSGRRATLRGDPAAGHLALGGLGRHGARPYRSAAARLQSCPSDDADATGDAGRHRHRHQLGPPRRGPDARRRRRAAVRGPRAGEGDGAARVERRRHERARAPTPSTVRVAALDRFRQVAEVHDAPITAVATSAVREAENRDVFIDRAWAEAGVHVDVISGRGGGAAHPPRRAAGGAGVRPAAPALRHRRRQHRAARRPARRGAGARGRSSSAPSASPGASSTAS